MAEALSPCFCPNCGFDLSKLVPVSSGRFHYDMATGFAIDGRVVPWRQQCHEIAGALLLNRRCIVSYDALMQRLGGEWSNPKKHISVLLVEIRRTFRILDIPCPIESFYGRGLRWID